MIAYYAADTAFQNMGYQQVFSIEPQVRIFCNFNGSKRKYVFVIDGHANRIYTKKSATNRILTLLSQATIRIPDLSVADILYVLYNTSGLTYIRCKNVIEINGSGMACRAWRISTAFSEEYRAIKEVCKRQYAYTHSKDQLHIFNGCQNYIMIILLIMLNIYCYIYANRNDVSSFSLIPETIQTGAYYRLLTYMFMHASILHLLGNMVALAYIGKAVINRMGSFFFIGSYLMGGCLAGVLSIYGKSYFYQSDPTVGASGAIFALIGSLLVYTFTEKQDCRARWAMLRYVVVTFICSAGVHTDNICHLGGLIAGFLLCLTYYFLQSGRKRFRRAKYIGIAQKQ